jgi:hypothetical protein
MSKSETKAEGSTVPDKIKSLTFKTFHGHVWEYRDIDADSKIEDLRAKIENLESLSSGRTLTVALRLCKGCKCAVPLDPSKKWKDYPGVHEADWIGVLINYD